MAQVFDCLGLDSFWGPAGRAHYAWGDHFVVGMSCLAGMMF
jgi:hypothetical protein